MMMQLIALTMMCDANRVMLMQWPGFAKFTWDGMAHQYDHHGLSHRNGSAAVGGTCVPGVIDMIGQIDNWYAARYVKLVSLIDSIKEGDRTMLDNSAVMWLPELADGNAHNNNNLPIVIAGSAGGYLKQGVSVNLDTKTLGTGNSEASCVAGTDVGFNTGSNTGNVPLNKLYVTLLNAIGATNNGAPITQFGLVDTNDVAEGHHESRRARRNQGLETAGVGRLHQIVEGEIAGRGVRVPRDAEQGVTGVPSARVGGLPVERAEPSLVGQVEHDVVGGALLGTVFGDDELEAREHRAELGERRHPRRGLALVRGVARLAEHLERHALRSWRC